VAVHVELSSRAIRDLKGLDPGHDRKAVIDALTVGLAAAPSPGNPGIKALKGAAPWLRLRVGDYRILYRPLTQTELKAREERLELMKWATSTTSSTRIFLGVGPRRRPRRRQRAEAGYLVARIVHRRVLERAVRTLPL
jgi:mRNA-degrading endonuclease RelE of RelBE toxin-antitoxin system